MVDASLKMMSLYMPGVDEIQMLVGRNVTATIKFVGSPITREVIEDTLAHLAFYKKYFPKEPHDDAALNTPEKIIAALNATFAEHRAATDETSRLADTDKAQI